MPEPTHLIIVEMNNNMRYVLNLAYSREEAEALFNRAVRRFNAEQKSGRHSRVRVFLCPIASSETIKPEKVK